MHAAVHGSEAIQMTRTMFTCEKKGVVCKIIPRIIQELKGYVLIKNLFQDIAFLMYNDHETPDSVGIAPTHPNRAHQKGMVHLEHSRVTVTHFTLELNCREICSHPRRGRGFS
jgi:hypothetical protein